jgi:shikimate dehydrogenase
MSLSGSLGARLVNGSTRLLVIIGHPIAQVHAPEVWSGVLRHHGINMICIPAHVLPVDLDTFFVGARQIRNLAGLIVTIPHKPAVVHHVDALTDRAARVRSVNFVTISEDGRWTGDITDGFGCVENMRAGGGDPRGARALLIGAGGVGSAIAFALAERGVAELAIYDTDLARADDVATRVAATGTPCRVGSPDPTGFGVVVNASPSGMKPDDPLPLDPDKLEAGTIVADVIVERTRLIEIAAARGCRVFVGSGMMVHQFAAQAAQLGLGQYDFSPATVARLAKDIQG